MPIVDELIEVAVKHGAGKKQDYASDMTIADVFRRFAEKMSEGSGGSGGGWSPYIVEIENFGTENMSTNASFSDALDAFLAKRLVIFSYTLNSGALQMIEVAYGYMHQGDTEFLGSSQVKFNSNGSIQTNT